MACTGFKWFPSSPREEVMVAWLSVGRDAAVVSHESALDLWEIGDVTPDAVHLTVPRSARGARAPVGVVLHTVSTPLLREEVQELQGMTATSVARRGFPQRARHTVADVIRSQRAYLGASRSAERERQLADALHAPALRGVIVGAFPQGLLMHWVDEDARVRAGGAIVSKASRWRRTEARALMADLNRQRSRIPLVLMAVDGGFSAWALRTVVRRGTTFIGDDLLMWRNPRAAMAQAHQQAAPDRRTS